MKEERNIRKRILKALLIIIGTPIILFWLLVILLYIPPIQRWAANLVCEELSESTGYDINIGTVHLAFPIKLKITDFDMSKNGDSYISGEKLDVNVSLWPLFVGDIELNYVALEHMDLETKDMFPTMSISGEVGYFRTVARNIELSDEVANLRQVHLHGAHLNVALKDTTVTEEPDDGEPSKWKIRLHKAKIENSSICVTMPGDTIKAKAGIETMRVRNGYADLLKESYSVEKIQLVQGSISYDNGFLSKKEAPLDHISLKELFVEIKDVSYNPDYAEARLHNLTFRQPGGIHIDRTSADIALQPTQLDIKDLNMHSANGSYISLSTSIPWLALEGLGKQQLEIALKAGLYKKDLAALLTAEQYRALDTFGNKLLDATLHARGNIGLLNIDTLHVDIPAMATIDASGHARNLLDTENLEAAIRIKGASDNLHEVLLLTGNRLQNRLVADINAEAEYDKGKINADISFNCIGGSIVGKAMFNMNDTTYNADIKARNLNVARMFPTLPLTELTMKLKAEGHGLDIMNTATEYTIALNVDSVEYDRYRLQGLALDARQKTGNSSICISADDPNLAFEFKANTELHRKNISNSSSLSLEKADLNRLGIMDGKFCAQMDLDVEFSTDMNKTHSLRFNGKDIALDTRIKRFTPKDIHIDFSTSPDTTYLKAFNGDLAINGNMKCGYTKLFSSLDNIKNMFAKAAASKDMVYYLEDYERLLPQFSFNMECGTDNMLANILAMNDIKANKIKANLNVDPQKGLNANAGIYEFRTGGLNLDTIRFFTKQEGNRLRYLAGIRSTSLDELKQKETYSAMLYGYMASDSLTANVVYRDNKDDLGLKMGFVSRMKPQLLEINFTPEAVFMGNPFFFNKGNYLRIGKEYSIEADVTIENGNNSGIHLYTTHNPEYKYNANIELFNISLKDITGALPYSPDMEGMLNADVLLKYGEEKGILVNGDIMADDVAYEGERIGNEIIELVYFPKTDGSHYLDAILTHEDEEVLHINGNLANNDSTENLKGEATLTHFPLSITKAFIKGTGFELEGYVDGDLTLDGRLDKMDSNGSIRLDSVYIHAHDFGTCLHMADEIVDIKDNRIVFDNFNIYANGDNPFRINGDIDIGNIASPALNLEMNAKDYQLINTPRTDNSMLYGKLLLDIQARISGPLNSLRMFGNITMLNKSNITYVMLETPIESDKELDGLVEFVNFNDTAKIVANEEHDISFGNTNINVNFNIENGARINADLDKMRNNYVTTEGSGNLQIKYNNENGLTVGGRYTMSNGVFKITLPIIPLKSLNISDGSEIRWSGDVFNPELNITALERVTSSVNIDGNNMLPVPFDVGVTVTNTLEKMKLGFIMSSPENSTVQNELNALNEEDMNRYAVTMLITGSYAGNKNISAANALSSFIDAKINDIAGTAMKGVNVNMGINDATNAETGSTYKNYSFSFSKRFWNDRITVMIGGEVNSGDRPRGSNSFINNASLEWKINEGGNRFLRIFYDKNYESILEGEITETGVGYIYKRKLNKLKELFMFRKKNDEEKEEQSKMN